MTQTDCAAVQKPQMFMLPKHRTCAMTGVNNDKDILLKLCSNVGLKLHHTCRDL